MITYEELLKKNMEQKKQLDEKNIEINEKNNEIDEKNIEIEKLQNKIENQQLQINQLTKYIFGPRSEKTKKEEHIVEGVQCSVFCEPQDEESAKQIEAQTEEITVYRKKKNKKKASGLKKAILKDIEKEVIEVEIKEEEQKCPECGEGLEKIGKEFVRQEIQYIPAKFKLVNYVRYTYKCKKCGTEESKKETATIVKAKVPNALLPHCFASSSLATEVIYQKYYMGVPLYRQEKVWDDKGLVLPRNMMANWCIKIKEYYLEPIYNLMLKQIKEKNNLLHVDETTMQCNKEPGRKATTNSYMWVIASGEEETEKGIIFHYSQSRGAKVAKELLQGYRKILVTDGYAGYNIVDDKITHAECWAHARRYFNDSIPLDENKKPIKASVGYVGVEYINKLFKIEEKIKEFSEEERLKIRQKESKPIVDAFYEWVNLTMQKYITNKKLKEALVYVTNQKENLSKFLNDGKIPIDNSRAERSIRPFATHRKNWLFADTIAGAEANAVWYTIVESAKINNLNINKYIKYLLEELPQLEGEQSEEELEKYLPWSKMLPEDIQNFGKEYQELIVDEL